MTEESHLGKFLWISAVANAASAVGLLVEGLQGITGQDTGYLAGAPVLSIQKQTLGFLLAVSSAHEIRAALRPLDVDFRKWICRTFCIGNIWFLASSAWIYRQGYKPGGLARYWCEMTAIGADSLVWGIPGIIWALVEGAVFGYYGFLEDRLKTEDSPTAKKASATWRRGSKGDD